MIYQITFFGTTCTSIASVAVQSITSTSSTLDVCTVLGIAGTLVAIAAVLLNSRRERIAAQYLLWASSACAVFGAIGLLAATQSWLVTAITTAGVAFVLAGALVLAKERKAVADIEAGLP